MARYLHTNFNVRDLEKSIAFYEKALGLKETRRVHGPDGAFTIVFLGDGTTDALLELTWRIRKKPIPSMKKWAAFVLKIGIWISIL